MDFTTCWGTRHIHETVKEQYKTVGLGDLVVKFKGYGSLEKGLHGYGLELPGHTSSI